METLKHRIEQAIGLTLVRTNEFHTPDGPYKIELSAYGNNDSGNVLGVIELYKAKADGKWKIGRVSSFLPLIQYKLFQLEE